MEDSYRTLEKPAEGLFRDRNSRFLAFGFPVDNLDQVNELLTMIRRKYHDAKHHCYAYRLGHKKDVYKANDDGEPSGTAGKPIYNQILSHDLTNVLIIVVRYFGGTLLGKGGLINAYKSAANDMLNNASCLVKFVADDFFITFPYENLNTVMRVLKEENLVPLNPSYEEQCKMQVSVRQGLTSKLIQKLAIIKEINIQSVK